MIIIMSSLSWWWLLIILLSCTYKHYTILPEDKCKLVQLSSKVLQDWTEIFEEGIHFSIKNEGSHLLMLFTML